jgi:phospholipid/cholesterol/gamma-HCH transport system permease protein
MENVVGALGRKPIRSVNRLMDLCALTCRLAAIAVPLHRSARALVKREIVEQVYLTAVQALPVIIPVALNTGSMLIVQFYQLSGPVDLGKPVVLVLREIGPLMTALVVIPCSATALTIEMSHVSVLNEIDASEVDGHRCRNPSLMPVSRRLIDGLIEH